MFPSNTNRPFLVVYPFGNVEFKIKNKRIFGAWDSFDQLTKHLSTILGDDTIRINEMALETEIGIAFNEKKGALVLIHDQKISSMSFRVLARSAQYSDFFRFIVIKDPSSKFLESMNIEKIPKLVFLYPKMEDFINDGTEPTQLIEYGGRFHFESIKEFLDAMIKEQVRFLKDIPEIQSQAQFEANCSGKSCLMFIIDKKKDMIDEDWDDRVSDMKVLRKLALLQDSTISVVFINLICFPYLTESLRFSIRDIPLLGLYKDSMFIRAKYRMNSITGKDFIAGLIHLDDSLMIPVSLNFILPSQDCRTDKNVTMPSETDL